MYERSKHIASDREFSTDGGVHDLLFNAVLTDNSVFHKDTVTQVFHNDTATFMLLWLKKSALRRLRSPFS